MPSVFLCSALEQQAHVEQVEGIEGNEAGALEEEAAVSQRDQEGRLDGGPCGGVDGGRQESACWELRKGALVRSLGSAHNRGRSCVQEAEVAER